MSARRINLLIVLLIIFLFILTGCQNQPGKSIKPENSTGKSIGQTEINRENLREFTTEQLARYDGSGGNPAYIAINGIVYDVTSAKGWRKGIHTPLSVFERLAGSDLTTDWEEAPDSHKKRKYLDNLPVVGKLEENNRKS